MKDLSETLMVTVKCAVEREHLAWCVAYMRHRGMGLVNNEIFKSRALQFLREQLSMFGTQVLMGESWREDLSEELPYAEAWVSKRFPKLR
jgi:hypothetical protein